MEFYAVFICYIAKSLYILGSVTNKDRLELHLVGL